jgi:hypothetical protein
VLLEEVGEPLLPIVGHADVAVVELDQGFIHGALR